MSQEFTGQTQNQDATKQKRNCIPFCDNAGVGPLVFIAFAVAIVFHYAGGSLSSAISKSFEQAVNYLNTLQKQPDGPAAREAD